MTTLLPQNTARLAWTVTLEEGQLGMLPEHRQRRRLNAARRLARYHVASRARQLRMIADEWQERTIEGREDASLAVRVSARLTASDITPPPTVTFAGQSSAEPYYLARCHQCGVDVPFPSAQARSDYTIQHSAANPHHEAFDHFEALHVTDPPARLQTIIVDPHYLPAGTAKTPEDLRALQDRINDMITDGIHAQENLGIPARFLAGQTSADAFRAWEAPRRAAYQAARDAAIARLEPAFEQLGRMIENLANPPRIVTIDEEHVITAEQLEQIRPGRIWMTTGPTDIERRSLASRYLAAIGQHQDGHVILGLEQVFTAHNLDLVRQWMVDAYPQMRDTSADPGPSTA